MRLWWLNGDLVSKVDETFSRRGVIVYVNRSNKEERYTDMYPYVYYVFFHDGKIEGPLFQSELHDV